MSTSKIKKNITKVSTSGDSSPEDEQICDNQLTLCDKNLTICTDEALIELNELTINDEFVVNPESESNNEIELDTQNLTDITIIEPKRPTELILNISDDSNKATKNKFYESDDAIISQIFSQTITSAGVTPTDDSDSFMFDQSRIDESLALELIDESIKQHSDELDNSISSVNSIETKVLSSVSNHSKIQQPSIIIDSYEDDGAEPCYVEPITPNQVKYYFDTTIVSDDEPIQQLPSSQTQSPTLEFSQPIQLTDIEVYKSLSTDDHSLTRNGNVVDITQDIYVDTSLVTSDSDETGNSYDNDEFDNNCDKEIIPDETLMVGLNL